MKYLIPLLILCLSGCQMIGQYQQKAAEVGELCEKLVGRDGGSAPDQRWVAIGKTDLQKGFMALTRSIAKPEFF